MPFTPIMDPFGQAKAAFIPKPEINWENEWMKSRGDVYELRAKLDTANRMIADLKVSGTDRNNLDQLKQFLEASGCSDLQQYADYVMNKSAELKAINTGLAADLDAVTSANAAEIARLQRQFSKQKQVLQSNIDALTVAKDELHDRARQELGEVEDRAAKLEHDLDVQVLQTEVLSEQLAKCKAASSEYQEAAHQKIAALELELENAKTSLGEQSYELQSLSTKLEEAGALLQDLEDQISTHKTENAELGAAVQSSLGLADQLKKGFEERSKKLNLDLEAAREEVATLQAAQDQASEIIAAQARTIEAKDVQIAERGTKIEELERYIISSKEEFEHLNSQLAQVTGERDQAQTTNAELVQERGLQKQKIQELEATIASTKAELSQAMMRNVSNENCIRSEIDNYEAQVVDLNNTIKIMKEDAEALRKERDLNAQQIVQLSHELSDSKQNALNQSTEHHQAKTDLKTSHITEVKVLKAQIEELRLVSGSLEEQQDRNMELQMQLANIEGLVKAKEQTIKERDKSLCQRDAEIDHLKIRIDTYANLEVLEKDHVRQNEALREKLNAIENTKNSMEVCLAAESKLRRQLQERLLDIKGTIRVFCRLRPPKVDETCHDGSFILDDYYHQVTLNQIVNGNLQKHTFAFDQVFGRSSTNADIFAEVDLLVQSCFNGFNACIFAYGQTGSGKTHTMLSEDGIVYRSMRTLFELVATIHSSAEVQIAASFIEIYNEKVRDLVGGSQDGREPGLVECGDYNALCSVLRQGLKRRVVATTAMNDQSSRSHSIFCIVVNSTDRKTGITTQGKVNLIDLAGSERPKRSLVVGQQLQEAKAINTSLTVLGNVIQALATNQKHVPFRSSKLTFALQDSFQGKCKTLMLVNLSPSLASLGESLTSLRFAAKVNSVKLARTPK